MCPCGTSSGSSSLQTIHDKFDVVDGDSKFSTAQAFHKTKTTYIFASTYPTILPFSSSAIYESCVDGENQERSYSFNQEYVWQNHNSLLVHAVMLLTWGQDNPW